jgi:hypothetical protein
MLSRRLAVAGAMLMPATALAQTDGCDYPPDAVKRVNHFSNILMDALKKGGYETDKQGAWAGILSMQRVVRCNRLCLSTIQRILLL